MKNQLAKIIFVVALPFAPFSAFAGDRDYQSRPVDNSCLGLVAQKEAALRQIIGQFNVGDATKAELDEAKLELSDANYGCGWVTKPHYCLYQQTVRRDQVAAIQTELGSGEASEAELVQAQSDLDVLINFCHKF